MACSLPPCTAQGSGVPERHRDEHTSRPGGTRRSGSATHLRGLDPGEAESGAADRNLNCQSASIRILVMARSHDRLWSLKALAGSQNSSLLGGGTPPHWSVEDSPPWVGSHVACCTCALRVIAPRACGPKHGCKGVYTPGHQSTWHRPGYNSQRHVAQDKATSR